MKIRFLALLGIILNITSCRLGNYISNGATLANRGSSSSTSTQSDGISGFYVSAPNQLKFFADISGPGRVEKIASTLWIPPLLSQRITNPVTFLLQNSQTGLAILASPSGTDGLPVFIDRNNHLNYDSSTTPRTFWIDSNCQKSVEVKETGLLTILPSVPSPTGNTLPLSGRIELTAQVTTHFQGNCSTSFEAIYHCYTDSTQCAGSDATENLDLQASVIQMLAPYIESQTFQVSDIPRLSGYGYEVSYQ